MEATFWINSWQQGGSATSFHRRDIHPYLEHFATPEFLQGKRVLVPLCGKTNDLRWFSHHAAEVIGVELVTTAIEQFFAEQELDYVQPNPTTYVSGNITILNRDVLSLTTADVGKIDLVYDRAALVALPHEMRTHYRATIDQILPVGGQQMIITLEYAPTMATPPFSITPTEIEFYYGERYFISHFAAPSQPEHRMVAKFNLQFLKEHGFLITRFQQ
ncbi:class I SAM-dependent methyltransferase [Herpetosiphon geysericola]|uniref:thiopurine S-methyltransferase n=1 Tax=Herpetosiphon geysericola TaxID=70996 RepID=A0A0P6XWR5_9CHLR|nr:hypothetical protein [Herpetosiphon geysericola]KPL88859.1 thiopurine S-methyltransferase [Herpetosiphon geysericola]